MSQYRDPPADQEFAAAMLANLDFRTAPFPARGLLYTMRLECWVNRRLPRNLASLAKVLGEAPAEVSELLPHVMPFFEIDGDFIFSPELEKYRSHLAERRKRQSEGGKNSAEARKGKRKTSATRMDKGDASTLASGLQVPTQVGCKSLVQNSTVQNSQNQSLDDDIWVEEYNMQEADSENEYLRASRG